MSKAHKAVLDSHVELRQRELKALKSVTTFAEMTASCVMLAQPPSSAAQSKLQLSSCWRALCPFVPYQATLPVYGSLWQREEGPGKLLGSSLSPLKRPWALLTRLGGLCWCSITCRQPGWCELPTHTQLQARALHPSLISNTDKPLQIYSSTPTHLITLLISGGILGQAKFGALPFSNSFKSRFFWLVAPSSTWPATAFPQLPLENQSGSSSHTHPGGRSACVWFPPVLELGRVHSNEWKWQRAAGWSPRSKQKKTNICNVRSVCKGHVMLFSTAACFEGEKCDCWSCIKNQSLWLLAFVRNCSSHLLDCYVSCTNHFKWKSLLLRWKVFFA